MTIALMPSGTALGHYVIRQPLGVGGMGEVYEAEDTRLHRRVALKVVRHDVAADPVRRLRLEREASAAAMLNHPHIVTVHSLEEHQAVLFVTMELIEGQTLAEVIPPNGLPLNRVLSLSVQLADALNAAHRRGVVHRDLKPANVMITRDGVVKVVDFGLSQIAVDHMGGHFTTETLTADNHLVGTVPYMSPEQIEGHATDTRSDIFSLGVVLFEMATGKRPFNERAPLGGLTSILKDDPPLAGEVNPAVPDEVSRIIDRCLVKDPDHRVQSAADLRNQLDDLFRMLEAGTWVPAGARGAIGSARTIARAPRVVADGRRAPAAPPAMKPSIAVLPFANMSGDAGNDYFGDGLAEEIINELAHLPGLRVIARTSAFAFKGKHEDVRRIAEALDVSHVLEGSVRKSGNRIRVTAQLLAARDGSHLWSERYDRELADVFAIQDDISGAIAAALRVTFSDSGSARRRYMPSLRAYDAYLKALYDYSRATPETVDSQRECLEEAIAIDPKFALAHAQLGIHFFAKYRWGLQSAHEAVPLARKHANAALQLDPSLPEAHNVLGCLAAMYDYAWLEADRRFRLAVAREPVPPLQVRIERANFFLAHVGRAEEALEDLQQALTEDPVNGFTRWTLAVCLRALRRDAEADARYEEVVQLDGGIRSTYAAIVLSGNHLERGSICEALRFAEIGYSRASWHPVAIGQFAGMLARTGDTRRAETLAAQLQPGDAFGAPFGLALYALAMGDLNRAADWLEKAIEQRDIWVPFLLRVGNIGGRVIWSSARWDRLAKMMNVN